MSATGVKSEGIVLPRVAPIETPRATAVACRLLDLTVSVLLLILMAPLFALIALLIVLDSGGPVLYRQRRVGLGLSEFTMNKFRTMHRETSTARHREYVVGLIRDGGSAAPEKGALYKLEGDDRITRTGRVLRRFSLDEMPQLWNVVRGDMSLVGPRPSIPYEVECYPEDWCRRFSVMPGMTGLWQVSGRSNLDLNQMVKLDLEYAERRSFWLNLRILARTTWVVIYAKGVA